MQNKKITKALVIVAHPDDETIWMGGTMLKNKDWDWTVVCLSCKNNKSRSSKFNLVCAMLGARSFISDMPASFENPVSLETFLSIDYIANKIKDILPKSQYDVVYTHGVNGEYGHIQHKEVHLAVKRLLEEKYLTCQKVFYFSYLPVAKNQQLSFAIPNLKASVSNHLGDSIFKIKKMLIQKIYRLKEGGLEQLSCHPSETFEVAEFSQSGSQATAGSSFKTIRKMSKFEALPVYYYHVFRDAIVKNIETKKASKSFFWVALAKIKDGARDAKTHYWPQLMYLLTKPGAAAKRKKYWQVFFKQREKNIKSKLRVTLALTCFNRYEGIAHILDYANYDDRIAEIIIVDDNSNNTTKKKLAKLQGGKVKIFFNEENVGPFKNKTLAISKASNPWVFLFDAGDMIDQTYLDCIEAQGQLNQDIVYCAAQGRTMRFYRLSPDDDFNYSAWEARVLNMESVRDILQHDSPSFRAFLNTSVYVINKEAYLAVVLPYVDKIFYNDSIHFKYLWLKSGRSCYVVKGMYYYHSASDKKAFYKDFRKQNDICTDAIIKSIINNTEYNINLAMKKEIKLHLGCGQRILPGYINIDEGARPGVTYDINANILDLKFEPSSVDEIRLHHVFEHFHRYQTVVLMLVFNQWLKKGGMLIIETPDFEWAARKYLGLTGPRDILWNTLVFLKFKKNYFKTDKWKILRHVFGSKEAQWASHYEGWDKSTLSYIFTLFGFSIIKVKQFKYKGWSSPNIIVTGKKEIDINVGEFETLAKKLLGQMARNEEELSIWMKEAEALKAKFENNNVQLL